MYVFAIYEGKINVWVLGLFVKLNHVFRFNLFTAKPSDENQAPLSWQSKPILCA